MQGNANFSKIIRTRAPVAPRNTSTPQPTGKQWTRTDKRARFSQD